jgi:hypothetical protein
MRESGLDPVVDEQIKRAVGFAGLGILKKFDWAISRFR